MLSRISTVQPSPGWRAASSSAAADRSQPLRSGDARTDRLPCQVDQGPNPLRSDAIWRPGASAIGRRAADAPSARARHSTGPRRFRRGYRERRRTPICLANSTYATGRRQSASTSKRNAESRAAFASRIICKTGRAIENGVDLLACRPRAWHLPKAQNMLIEACGWTANWLPRKHPSRTADSCQPRGVWSR
jgi:hypothetical protein